MAEKLQPIAKELKLPQPHYKFYLVLGTPNENLYPQSGSPILFECNLTNACDDNISYISSNLNSPSEHQNYQMWTGIVKAKFDATKLPSYDNGVTALVYKIDANTGRVPIKDNSYDFTGNQIFYRSFSIKTTYTHPSGRYFINRIMKITNYDNITGGSYETKINDRISTFNESFKKAYTDNEVNITPEFNNYSIPDFLIDKDGMGVLVIENEDLVDFKKFKKQNEKFMFLFNKWMLRCRYYHNTAKGRTDIDAFFGNKFNEDNLISANYTNNIGLICVNGFKLYNPIYNSIMTGLTQLSTTEEMDKFKTDDEPIGRSATNLSLGLDLYGTTLIEKNGRNYIEPVVFIFSHVIKNGFSNKTNANDNEIEQNIAIHELCHAWSTGVTQGKTGDSRLDHTYYLDGANGYWSGSGNTYCNLRDSPKSGLGQDAFLEYLVKRAEQNKFSKGIKQRISNIMAPNNF